MPIMAKTAVTISRQMALLMWLIMGMVDNGVDKKDKQG
jgi:hypothetical protein